jgi:hypothetical protein
MTRTGLYGEFSLGGLSGGSYLVELVSNGSVVGTSSPIVLSERDMSAEGIVARAAATMAGGEQPPPAATTGGFWSSTGGILLLIAIIGGGAGLTWAIIEDKDDEDASPST